MPSVLQASLSVLSDEDSNRAEQPDIYAKIPGTVEVNVYNAP